MKKKPATLLPIAVFVLFFGIFSLISIFRSSKEASVTENRALQTMPEVSYDEVMKGSFQEKYETYISDQFVGRAAWVSVKTAILKTMGKRDMNGEYIGKDGYLIERYNSADFEEEHVNENMGFLSSFLKAAGEAYGSDHVTLAWVPSKGSVMTDKLPAFADEYDSSWVIDSVNNTHGEGVLPADGNPDIGSDVSSNADRGCRTVDLEPVLKSHSDEYIYYRTDHHWTTLGAYYAYEELCRKQAIGDKLPKLSDYTQTVVSDEFYGTGYDKVQLRIKPDEVTRFDRLSDVDADVSSASVKTSVSGNNITVDFNDGTEKWDTFYYEKGLTKKDKYTYFLGGNEAKIHIHVDRNTDSDNMQNNQKTLLLIKDSFSNCFVEFLAENYDDIYMIDLRYTNDHIVDIIDSIEEENPITDILVMFNREKFMTDNNIEQLECDEDELIYEDDSDDIIDQDDQDDQDNASDEDEDDEDEDEDDGVTEEEDIF